MIYILIIAVICFLVFIYRLLKKPKEVDPIEEYKIPQIPWVYQTHQEQWVASEAYKNGMEAENMTHFYDDCGIIAWSGTYLHVSG